MEPFSMTLSDLEGQFCWPHLTPTSGLQWSTDIGILLKGVYIIYIKLTILLECVLITDCIAYTFAKYC